MGAVAVDQRDARAPRLAQPIAQPGRQFETAGAAADDDDMMGRGIAHT